MTITEPQIDRPPSDTAATATWAERAADVAARIAPYAPDHDRDGTFVHAAFDVLRAEGFIEALVPAEFGGGGASHVEAGAILTELAKGCPSTAVTLSMHYHLVATQVWRHQHGQPAEGVLRKVAAGAILISTGAADWVNSSGEAVRVDGGFRVSARKAPSSGAPVGSILVASAPWAGDDDSGPSVIHFAVPFAAEGVSIDATWDAMGLRGTGSHTVVLDDVFVPDEAVSLIRPADEWHPVWNAVLGAAMPLIMSAYLGVAEAAADLAVAHATAAGGPEHVLPSVGEMLNQLTTARDLVAAMLDASKGLTFAPTLDHTAASLSRKTAASEAMIATVRGALDVCGGAGFSSALGLERLYRDVHGSMHHPLPAARQKLFTARLALGLDPLG